jgi:colicin import membrane protein
MTTTTDNATTIPIPPETPETPETKKKGLARHKVLTGVGGVAALVLVGAAIAGASEETLPNAETAPVAEAPEVEVADAQPVEAEVADAQPVEAEVAEAPEAPEVAEAPEVEVADAQPVEAEVAEAPEDGITLAQENALRSAEDYLDYSAFSKQGLIDQLVYEEFSVENATWAVDQLTVDWNEQAVRSGQAYLDYSSFSRQGLIDQLVFEDYTVKQATYAVDTIGL